MGWWFVFNPVFNPRRWEVGQPTYQCENRVFSKIMRLTLYGKRSCLCFHGVVMSRVISMLEGNTGIPRDAMVPGKWKANRGITWRRAGWEWTVAMTQSTSTVYWCIASKLKAARNLYWMSNVFLWVKIFLFFVCYHVFPKRHSQLDYELNDL